MAQEKIPIREFARRLNIHEATVRKAIRTGKIVDGIVMTETGKPMIVPEVAMVEWGRAYNPNYQRDPELHAKLDAAASSEPAPAKKDPEVIQANRSIAELKRLTSEVRLQKEAIELRKLKGELVEKSAVYSSLFSMGQEIRATFEMIPDRIIDDILASGTRNAAHEVLTVAISEALDNLSRVISRGK